MLTLSFRRRWAGALMMIGALAMPCATQAVPQEKPMARPPSPAQLLYKARADVRGMRLDGESRIDWQHDSRRYQLTLETRTALTGVLLQEKSEGGLDRTGLVPDTFSTRRFLKPPSVTRFDREAGEIDFAGEGNTHALAGGEQDRISVLWQLVAMMRARPAAFTAGSRWDFFVAGQRDGDPWTFEVKSRQKLRSPLGELDTLHVVQVPDEGARKTRVDVWFAPSQEWLPVRIRFSEANGDFIEQSLERITRP